MTTQRAIEALRTSATDALETLTEFMRFMSIMNDGPDESDKAMAHDIAECAFLRAANTIPTLRAALAAVEAQPHPLESLARGKLPSIHWIDHNNEQQAAPIEWLQAELRRVLDKPAEPAQEPVAR